MSKANCFIIAVLCSVSLRAVSQTAFKQPALSDPKSWSIILIPDPQGYAKFGRNQPLLDVMMNWVADNSTKLNTKLVMCTGDLVEQNYIYKTDSINGDQLSSAQWKAVSSSFGKLDNRLPYILCAGNHDFGTNYTENRYSQFNSYFPPDKNPKNRAILIDMAPNAAGVKTMENACYEFVAPNGQKMLIFSLEFLPRKSVVEWAKKLSSRPRYVQHIGVILTHSYMSSMLKQNQRIKKEQYQPAFKDITTGEQLWQQLIYPSQNIQLVICGHVVDLATHQGHVGFRTDKNAGGANVQQMLFNAQNEGGNWQGNGGDGWLRILEFLPDGKTVKVKTFSPLFAVSPSTSYLAWRNEPFDEFTFKLNEAQSTILPTTISNLFLTNYTIKPDNKGAVVGFVKSKLGTLKKAKLIADTSGLFTIGTENQLKLKKGHVLKLNGPSEYEITIGLGEDQSRFVIAKDLFLHNKVIAHRGAWKNMEASRNSLNALQNAIDMGCEGSEFDVWLSADGIAVVSHDGIVGGKKIEETLAKDLQKVYLGFNDYLPTLEEYLLTIKGQNKTRLFLEIKSSDKGQKRSLELSEKVVETVQSMKLQAWVRYISFDYSALKKIQELDPSSKTAYLWGDRPPSVLAKDQMWGTDYPYDYYKKNPNWIEEAHKNGLTVNVWTINTNEEMEDLLNLGVDLITTDEPYKLLELIKKRNH